MQIVSGLLRSWGGGGGGGGEGVMIPARGHGPMSKGTRKEDKPEIVKYIYIYEQSICL